MVLKNNSRVWGAIIEDSWRSVPETRCSVLVCVGVLVGCGF